METNVALFRGCVEKRAQSVTWLCPCRIYTLECCHAPRPLIAFVWRRQVTSLRANSSRQFIHAPGTALAVSPPGPLVDNISQLEQLVL